MNAPLGRGRPGKRANRTPDINPWRHEAAPQQLQQQALGDYNQGKHANNDHLGPGLVPDVGAERVHRGRHAGRDADHLGANLVPDASMGGGMRHIYEGAGARPAALRDHFGPGMVPETTRERGLRADGWYDDRQPQRQEHHHDQGMMPIAGANWRPRQANARYEAPQPPPGPPQPVARARGVPGPPPPPEAPPTPPDDPYGDDDAPPFLPPLRFPPQEPSYLKAYLEHAAPYAAARRVGGEEARANAVAGSPELAAAYAEIVRLQAMVDMLSKQLNEQGGHVPYGVAMQHRGSEASYEPER